MILKNVFPRLIVLCILAGMLAGCRGGTAVPAVTDTPAPPPTAAATATPETPTPTPAPLAARVNGEGVLLSDFEAELARYQAANPGGDAAAQRQAVLDDLIAQHLLAQAAAEGGFQMDDAALQARVDALAKQAGGVPALQDWMKRNGYSEQDFRQALRLAAAAAWQRDRIIADVPEKAEQVHARQILVLDEGVAGRLLEQIRGGADFSLLAAQYDPVTGGELGWFPRGYLTQLEVEEAAFALQGGEVSPVVKSAVGYHIIQVVERETERQLSADARKVLQENRLRDWVQQQREAGTVEILLP